jgi:hypothetical protein
MPVLNRFPLLGLWAREAARRLGYTKEEAEALGHAYAVLYAIRAATPGKAKKKEAEAARPGKRPAQPPGEQIDFCGDRLDVVREGGRLRGHVGGDGPQTPHTYEVSVEYKFPPGYYEKLEKAFREVLRRYPPRAFKKDRLLYTLYDQWKKSCGVGRSVDLDDLLEWCREHRPSSAP